jgi:hypothetical protein
MPPPPPHISGSIAGRIGSDAAALDEAQLVALRAARAGQRPFRRAAAVATVSGIALLLCAGGSLLLALFGLKHLIAATLLAVLGTLELRGASALRAGRLGAGRRLLVNQLVLGGLIVVYGGVGIARTLVTDPATMGLSTQTATFLEQHPEMGLGGLGRVIWLSMLALYGGVILFGVLCQGLMALYYARTERRLRRWRAGTPTWAADLLEEAA